MTFSQEKSHIFSFGVSKLAYQNSLNIPSGLPGVGYVFQYEYNKCRSNASENKKFIELNYNVFQRENLYIPFRSGVCTFGMDELWSIRPFSAKCFSVKGGLGASFLSEYCSAKPNLILFKPYFEWNLTLNGLVDVKYIFGKISLKNEFKFMLLNGGFFQEYQRYEVNNFDYYITPNSVNTFANYLFLQNRTTFSYDIKRTQSISLSYEYRYRNSTILLNKVMKEQHLLFLGYTYRY